MEPNFQEFEISELSSDPSIDAEASLQSKESKISLQSLYESAFS
jgi:hypothetical protein